MISKKSSLMAPSKSFLTPPQRYAAGALFGLALHQAKIYQTRPLGYSPEEEPWYDRTSSDNSSDSVPEDPENWIHDKSGLLRPVLRLLEIDSAAWTGLEEITGSSSANHHIGAFLRLLSEEGENSSERADEELALSKAVDGMRQSIKMNFSVSSNSKREKHREYENECRKRCFSGENQATSEEIDTHMKTLDDKGNGISIYAEREPLYSSGRRFDEKHVEEVTLLSYQRKLTILFELLSACLADKCEDKSRSAVTKRGYDSRHRVALRFLATWLDIKWTKVEAIEAIVACSAMTLAKAEESKEDTPSSEGGWAKWKRGGVIGAAALTGGTLMAITGGLAAPAIAAGFSALAPTLGTLIPVIGASGFAAAATAAGSVAGSVAVAASFGAAGAGLTGIKMARRTGSVDEFEFKAIGENHNQGLLAVEILVSGFVFNEEDFVKPWEGTHDNLERYVLQWESQNLIAVSTAIQDWLTSSIASGLMKQGAMLTVLGTLMAALAWPAALITATDFIDSKWSIAVDRSDKAGKILAEDVLLKGLQGHRPVTLIGYSLGARVILKCLQSLAESEESGDGLVERVVLLGAPISIKDENWEAARKVVAGRFVNAYSANDWTLGVAFRASLLSKGLAGIQPIEVPGIENVNVTDLIEGHSSYLWATQQILEHLELDTSYPVSGIFLGKEHQKGF